MAKTSSIPQPPKTGFTDVYLKHLKPQPQRFEIGDPGEKGLRLRVSPEPERDEHGNPLKDKNDKLIISPTKTPTQLLEPLGLRANDKGGSGPYIARRDTERRQAVLDRCAVPRKLYGHGKYHQAYEDTVAAT